MTPNVEKILVAHLLDDAALTAVLGGANRVSTELPANADLPRIRLTLGGGRVVIRTWLYAVRVTVEAWADSKDVAWDAITTAVASLEQNLDGALVEGGVIAALDQEGGILWSPDTETRKARYLTSVVVTIHPETQ